MSDLVVVKKGDPEFPSAICRGALGIRPTAIWAIGDRKILKQPLLAFFCSARCPGAAIVRTYDVARVLRDAGVPVIGGFHSPMERECLELLLRGSQPVVICPARGIQRMRLPAAWRDGVRAGRVLVLSPFEAKHRQPTRELAEQRNRFVAELATDVFLAHAEPGSRTEALARELLAAGRRVWLLRDCPNSTLELLGAKHVSVEGLTEMLRLRSTPERDGLGRQPESDRRASAAR